MTGGEQVGGDSPKIQIVAPESTRAPAWAALGVQLDGSATSCRAPLVDFSLWAVTGHLDAGSTLTWSHRHGDEVLYVLSGGCTVDGRSCPPGGAVVIEADVAARLEAAEPTQLLHFGPNDPQPPADGYLGPAEPGQHVHVVGPQGAWARSDGDTDNRFYADSSCATCRATLLYTSQTSAYETPVHSHSQDEIIYVLDGALRLGGRSVDAGEVLAVSRDVRYRFRSDGFALLNYRRDVSHGTADRNSPPLLESAATLGYRPVP